MSGSELQQALIEQFRQAVLWLPVYFAAFAALAAVAPNVRGQKAWRSGMLTDLGYWFLTPPLYTILYLATLYGVLIGVAGKTPEQAREYIAEGSAWVAALPFWAQIAGVLLLSDILQYWLHRLFHRGALWRFHAIHHSPRELDWLSSARFHPFNYYVSFTVPGVLCALAGVPAQTFAIIAGFNAAFSYLVHANLNWTFGPARYLVASPVFHRWHHSTEEGGRNGNFAPTFAFIDLLFGTFLMPRRPPEKFGIPEAVPHSFLGQLAFPFRGASASERSATASGAVRPE